MLEGWRRVIERSTHANLDIEVDGGAGVVRLRLSWWDGQTTVTVHPFDARPCRAARAAIQKGMTARGLLDGE